MTSPRPKVPEAVKLQLRQEAGFGCCKCGLPIYQYQHIIPYAHEPHFRPEDMMLLCPNCHAEATLGAMTEPEQRFHKCQPYNITKGFAAGKLKTNQDFCAVKVGTNEFVGDCCFVQVDDEPLLKLEIAPGGGLELSVALYDEHDHLSALIEKNEWISGDPLPWDLKSSFQYIQIRKKLGDIALEIDTGKEPVQVRADLWRKEQNIRLDPEGIHINGVVKDLRFYYLCFVGMQLSIDTMSRIPYLRPDPRYTEGKFVSWPDPQERLRKGYEEWRRLNRRMT